MSEFKGTPGPWVRDHNMVYSLQDSDSKLTDKENRFYAGFYHGRNCSNDELAANVQVAMTAPELLNVLLQALPHVREQAKVDSDAFTTLQLMSNIIKKALGEV